MVQTMYIKTKVGRFEVRIINGRYEPDELYIFNPSYDGGIRLMTLRRAKQLYGSVNKAIGSIIAHEVWLLS